MPTPTEIAQFFAPITQQVTGASYVSLNINPSTLTVGEVVQDYVTPQNRGGQPAMNVQIFGLKEFVEANAPSGSSYVLPIASASVLGGIKVGSGLSIAGDGTLSATGGGVVTSVTASLPLSSSGGVTPNITITQAGSGTDGYLSSTDWNTFYNKQNALSGTGFVKISGTTISYDNTTYYPYPTGSTAQYVRGDGSIATFPTIPTVGTWGILNYPTWVSGTPFVKMTAAGTFSLDTNTYLTTISGLNISLLTNDSGYITSSALSPYLTTATAAATYVPLTRTITINGTALDLSADRSWTVSGAASLSTLTAATGSNTIANVANAQVWNWNLNGTANNAFTIADTGTTGTGVLLTLSTAATSNVIPFRVNARTTTIIDTAASSVIGALALTSLPTVGLTIGSGMTTGTTIIGGAAQTGTITLGSSTGTNIINIGNGTGATTVSIANGITNAKTINIGSGAAMANTIGIGGTGNNTIIINASTSIGSVAILNTSLTGAVNIGNALTTGTINIGARQSNGALAPSINIGGTGTLQSATTIAQSIIIGSAISASSTGNVSQSISIGSGQVDAASSGTSTQTVDILGGNLIGSGSGVPSKILNLGNGLVGGNAINMVHKVNIGVSGTESNAVGVITPPEINIGTGYIRTVYTGSGTSNVQNSINIGTGILGANAAGSGTYIAGRTINIGTGTIGTTVGQANSVINIGSTSVSNTYTQTINITTGGANGLMYIGKTTTEKIGFWNTTPIVQPTTAVAGATTVFNVGTALTDATTFDGYTLAKVVKALRNIGLLS